MAIGSVLFAAVAVGPVIATTPAWAASPPSAPAAPKTAPGNAQARLNWVAPANGGSPITGYVVTPFIGATAQASHTFNSTALIEIVTGLTNGTTYTFKVAAKNIVGTGPRSGASITVMPTTQPTLKVAANATMGQPILVNSYGYTVYLFKPDSSQNPEKTSTEGGFRGAWPFVGWSGSVTVGPGLTLAKATAHLQPDNTLLMSYNNHLLYTFVTDHAPGQVTGQGAAAYFFVLNASGNEIPYLPPRITSISPASGAVGTVVTINGTHLSGATKVSFNGTAAVITTDTATRITTKVPAGATTGKITVTTAGGTTGTSAQTFTVT